MDGGHLAGNIESLIFDVLAYKVPTKHCKNGLSSDNMNS